MLQLRDYQEKSLDGLRAGFAAGHRAQMLYLPTGGGKTEIAISMLQAAADKGHRSAMVMDRRVLCNQTSERLEKYDIDHGVLMAGHPRFLTYKSIQVCSAQTLEKRGSFPGLKLLIVDEAHGVRKSVADFIRNNEQIKVVGLSASPFTKGLGNIYSNVVSRSTTKDLVDTGRLAPLRVFIAKQIDMTGAKKVAGEWSAGEAGTRGIEITGDIVTEWLKKTLEIFGEPKKTIVFCAGVAHGKDLERQFKACGFNFVPVSYKDEDEFKKQTLIDFAKPDSKIQGLIATDILSKGFDQADVMIGISARPFTKSFSSHVQQLGRIMRPHESKTAGIWLDHSGNYLRFKDEWEALYEGGVTELDDGAEKPKAEPSDIEKEQAKCPECGSLWQSKSDMCPHCGHVRVRRNEVITLPGELHEIRIGGELAAETPHQLYQMCCWYARTHSAPDKQAGRAYYLYKGITGAKPDWDYESTPSALLSRPVQNKITQFNVAYSASLKKKRIRAYETHA
ncbi:MAG: DEAD/DEAH box helicase family protein [Candidatus Moranbacteria bacterium]|nr:DEAD/DEAH box helicase family protein [Candidatus Moranbacteria bacterium]